MGSSARKKAQTSSKVVSQSKSEGRSVSLPVHMFKYDLPTDGIRTPEAVGLCAAAVPPTAVTLDWAQVTCKNCFRLEQSRARRRARRRNGR